jgi:adenosylmethionine-8-amino-7-oxononanoate aminotransferase|tara:strand:+ start:123 stop:911 length:789 start_codon:yes stop_codon:yes gene_type:complete
MPKTSYEDADQLEKVIEIEGPNTISAFIGEPVIGAAAGAYVAPEGYWRTISEICQRHGILLIADEVMTGFGRLGTPMGHQLFEFTPDIIVSGKGLGGGYVPMGGVYTRPDVVAPIAETDLALMFYTFAGHDLGCAVSKKVLQIMREENLVNRAFEMGARLRAKLLDEFQDHPHVSDIRGAGLMHGIALVADRDSGEAFPRSAGFAEQVSAASFDDGVWVYPAGSGVFDDALLFGPPFIVSDSHIDQMVTTVSRAIDLISNRI